MRLAILSDSWIPNVNGAVYSIQNEIMALAEKGYEITLFVPKTKKAVYSEAHLPLESVVEHRSIPFPGYKGYNIALPDLRLRAEIKNKRFDLIHCQTPFSLWVMAWILRRTMHVPMVTTFHTDILKYAGHLLGGFARDQLETFLYPLAHYIVGFNNYSNAVIAPTEPLKRVLVTRGVLKTPICVVPSPLSSHFFTHTTKETKKSINTKIKEKYSIASDALLLVYLGRISFEKRLDLLLKAYKNLLTRLNDPIHLLIVGDGPYLSAYKKVARKLGLEQEMITFTGFIPHEQTPSYYAAGDLFVSPSDTETQGLTFIEAMSQATPVIGVKAGGVQNIIRHGYNGILVPPNNIFSLERGIKSLLANRELRKEMGEHAYQTTQTYTLKKFGDNLIKVFEIAQENYNQRTGRNT